MAIPAVATYSMSRCVTGRSRTPGDRCNVTVRSVCKAKTTGTPPLGGSYASGYARIYLQGVGLITVSAVCTAESIASNTLITNHGSDSSDPTIQYYIDNAGIFPDDEHIVIRYLITLPTTGPLGDKTYYYILSSPISSSQLVEGFPFDIWYPANSWNGSFSVSAATHWPAKEKVTIQQITSAGGWTWHTGQPNENIGKLKATFEDVANLPTIEAEPILYNILTVNGISVPITNPGAITFTEDSGWHIHGGVETWIYWFPDSATELAAAWEPGGIDNVAELYRGSIGTSEGQCYLPAGITYHGWLGLADGTEYHGYGEGSEVWFASNRATAIAPAPPDLNYNTYVDCVWTRLGGAYQFQGTLENMDGSAPAVTPEWKDISPGGAGDTWTGNTSPLYTYSGTWGLTVDSSLDELAAMTWEHSPETDYTGGGTNASWSRTDDNAPTEFCLELNNPTAYNLAANDKRVWILYPRSKALCTWALNNNILIDSMSTADWVGTNCTVSIVGGNVVVTDILAGGKITLANVNKHWPPHRFTTIEVDVEDDI